MCNKCELCNNKNQILKIVDIEGEQKHLCADCYLEKFGL